MLSPFPKTASCVYSLGTGKIPCTTQKSYLHRKPQSPFSAQTIKARFKKALYTWQAQSDHRWSRTPWAILGRAPFHSHIQTAKLPPATSVGTKMSGIWVTVAQDAWNVHLLVSSIQKLLHGLYTMHMGEIKSLPQLKEHKKSVGLLSQNEDFTQEKKKKKKYWSKEFTYPEKTKKLSFTLYSQQRSAQQLPRNHHFITEIVHNNITNSDFSNYSPLKVAISTHSKSLWDLGSPATLRFPKSFPHIEDTAIIQ